MGMLHDCAIVNESVRALKAAFTDGGGSGRLAISWVRDFKLITIVSIRAMPMLYFPGPPINYYSYSGILYMLLVIWRKPCRSDYGTTWRVVVSLHCIRWQWCNTGWGTKKSYSNQKNQQLVLVVIYISDCLTVSKLYKFYRVGALCTALYIDTLILFQYSHTPSENQIQL